MKKISKKAFTLAEVLITLTIIGVIAAIAVPVITARQRDAVLTVQFKKAYSVMQQALNKTIMIDYGGENPCGSGNASECLEFWNALAQNLNLMKTCPRNEAGCLPEYTAYGGYGFSKETMHTSSAPVYILSDGQAVIRYADDAPQVFMIDINGHKGPNTPQKDLFSFKIGKDKLEPCTNRCGNAAYAAADTMMLHAFAGQE